MCRGAERLARFSWRCASSAFLAEARSTATSFSRKPAALLARRARAAPGCRSSPSVAGGRRQGRAAPRREAPNREAPRNEGSLDAQAERRLSGPAVRVRVGEFARAPPLHPFLPVSPQPDRARSSHDRVQNLNRALPALLSCHTRNSHPNSGKSRSCFSSPRPPGHPGT